MIIFEKLLENYWFIREQDEEEYNNIRNNITDDIQNFIKTKLGYKLIINPYLIKLEKIPGTPQKFMGIQEFDDKIQYVFLCLILIYLEEKTRGEQFILSELIDYIQNVALEINLEEIKLDFTIYSQRKSMVKVLKFIKEMGFVKLYDGEEGKFIENTENDMLYEVTGISKYFTRNFLSNIMECNSYEDIYKQEQLGLEQDKGIERRNRVYRRIFTENIVYKESGDDQDYNYIKNYRGTINQDVDKMLDSSFEVHKNGAYILLADNKNFKNVFPANRGISDVVLFINKEIKNELTSGKLNADINDLIYISNTKMLNIINIVKNKYKKGFSKEYREMPDTQLLEKVVEYMKQFDMLREIKDIEEYIIMPIFCKIIGKYPKEFTI